MDSDATAAAEVGAPDASEDGTEVALPADGTVLEDTGADAAVDAATDATATDTSPVDSGADGASVDGSSDAVANRPGPSCDGLASTCGPGANESCCASEVVPGGAFDRSYDGVNFTDPSFPASVSDFRLDRFKVTVGRYRRFVAAAAAGWAPAAGTGKHAHLHGGAGLNGGTEAGWDATWTASLATTKSGWDANLACSATMATWTPAAGANEDLPVNCLMWAEAYAFCIWDGGFLPTEAEWNYAAAGGSEQRVEPWSVPASATAIDGTYASYDCLGDGVAGCAFADITPVGAKSPRSDARWGQADLVGDVWEWNLDWFLTTPPQPCVDCAAIGAGGVRMLRGGAWNSPAAQVNGSFRNNQPLSRWTWVGARCARAP